MQGAIEVLYRRRQCQRQKLLGPNTKRSCVRKCMSMRSITLRNSHFPQQVLLFRIGFVGIEEVSGDNELSKMRWQKIDNRWVSYSNSASVHCRPIFHSLCQMPESSAFNWIFLVLFWCPMPNKIPPRHWHHTSGILISTHESLQNLKQNKILMEWLWMNKRHWEEEPQKMTWWARALSTRGAMQRNSIDERTWQQLGLWIRWAEWSGRWHQHLSCGDHHFPRKLNHLILFISLALEASKCPFVGRKLRDRRSRSMLRGTKSALRPPYVICTEIIPVRTTWFSLDLVGMTGDPEVHQFIDYVF
jgi:hypothetical protein